MIILNYNTLMLYAYLVHSSKIKQIEHKLSNKTLNSFIQDNCHKRIISFHFISYKHLLDGNS